MTFTKLVKEVKKVFDIRYSMKKVKFRIWEDNKSFIAADESKKQLLLTKYMVLKHNFCRVISRGDEIITFNYEKEQIANILTKPSVSSIAFALELAIKENFPIL